MSADGTWKLTMQTPIGERKSTLALKEAGGGLTGKLTGKRQHHRHLRRQTSGDNVNFWPTSRVRCR
jgi:hypothetical protein